MAVESPKVVTQPTLVPGSPLRCCLLVDGPTRQIPSGLPAHGWTHIVLAESLDAAPYNAAWQNGHLNGFFDWDFAGPVKPEFDLAFCCMSWVPLHARDVAEAEGFRDFARRPQRLRRLLAAYGWEGAVEDLRLVMVERIVCHIRDVEALAAGGDPAFQRLVQDGVLDSMQLALSEVETVEL